MKTKILAPMILAISLGTFASLSMFHTTAAPRTNCVYVETTSNYYNLPPNPADGDEILLTLDINGYATVDAGTHYLNGYRYSPVSQMLGIFPFTGTSNAFHAFVNVVPGGMIHFHYHAASDAWASNLIQNTD